MDERSVTPQIRTFFWGVGSAFAGIAGLVLFLFPEETDTLFAWTITRGDTAAFVGALFLAVGLVALLCYGESSWAAVSVCFVGTLAFVTAMSLATLLHLDQFHFGSDEPIALVAAWAWTLVYLVAPPAGLALRARQLRPPATPRPTPTEPGTIETGPIEPGPIEAGPSEAGRTGAGPGDGGRGGGRTAPIVPGLRYLYLAQGAVLMTVAVVLFVAPGAATLWPWPLTPLAARAIASFLLGFGIMLLGVGWENRAERLEPPCAACWWLVLLTGMAVSRFEGGFDLGSVAGLVFFVMGVTLLVGGLAGELAARRLRPSAPAAGPGLTG